MTVLHHAHDRISFAAEGAALAAGDALDFVLDRTAAFAAVLVAAIAAGLLLLSLGGSAGGDAAPSAASAASAADPTYVAERGYSLSLPGGWERQDAPDGAAFAAVSADGYAETTLWVERQPGLSFDAFVEKSTASLDELGHRRRGHRPGRRADPRVPDRRAERRTSPSTAAPSPPTA